MTDALRRNLRLIALHELLVRTSPWLAVFVLFTRARFGLDGAIQLSGLYYLSVVLFEAPSGWASDHFGRVVTLRFVGLAWIGAFTCWLVGDESYAVIALGQVLLALGYASLSGTDVTFHYDTLEAMGRADEYADRQASVASRGLAVGAVGALLGGAIGLVDLRFAFAGSLLLAIAQFGVTLAFTEPPRTRRSEPVFRHIARSVGYLRDVPLRWVFFYGVALVVLEHVAFTLLQPWLTEVLGETADDVGETPVVVGLTLAVVGVIGAIGARLSAPAARRFGLRATLVGLGATSAVIVTMMGLYQHAAVLALVALRSVQGAAAPILISAAVAPLVAQRHRATLLSLNSLSGRLLWGSILLVLSTNAGDDVGPVLLRFAGVSWTLVALTLVTAAIVRRHHGPVPI